MEQSLVWNGTLQGDSGPYSADQWQEMMMRLIGAFMNNAADFILPASGSGSVDPLRVRQTAAASTSVRVAPGSAMVRGIYYRSTAEEVIPIPANLSGNPRYDLIVARADWATQTIRLARLQGSPAGSPIVPALTQTAGVIWEMPLAHVYLPNGFLSIQNALITNYNHPYHPDILIPPGTLMPYAAQETPVGWLLCYGQAVSRTVYARLFAVIGTTYGAGDGATTFNVPDLRGRFPLGRDNLGGASANRVTNPQADALGGSGGAETHTLTIAEMPAHTHNVPIKVDASISAGGGVNYPATPQQAPWPTSSAGGGGSHNSMNPYLTLGYIIKI